MSNFDLRKFLIESKLTKQSGWVPLTASDLEEIGEEIFNLISNAYKSIGGHPNYKTKDNVNSSADYEVINLDDDPDIDAVSVTKTKPSGTKFVATGHDGSREAKSAVVNHKADLLKTKGFYIEVSGKLVDILVAKGVAPITDEETVRKVLKGKDIEWLGDGRYRRGIGGEKHVKQMFGKPIT